MEKTLRIHLKELREKLANDIIAMCDCKKPSCGGNCNCKCEPQPPCVHERLAAMVRGSQE